MFPNYVRSPSYVTELCEREYPISITVSILNTDNAVIKNTSFLGPVTNIDSSIDNFPRSVKKGASDIITFNETSATASYDIPITLECTGEAPKNATVTIQCTGTGVVYDNTILVEYAKRPMNITGLISVPQYQQCNITVVFSNEAGSSKPFILAFDTTPIIDPTPSLTSTSSPDPIITRPVIIGISVGGSIAVLLIVIIIIVIIVVICYKKRNKKRGQLLPERVQFDGSSACSSVSMSNSEHDMVSKAQTETTVVPEGDNIAPKPYDIDPVEASPATPGNSEVMAKQVNKNKKQSKSSTSKKETITEGGAAKELIYSDLGLAPATTKLAKTEAPSVLYADIKKTVPKATAQPQSYDDVVVSTASGTTVIGATPPAIPDKKSNGATTTGQETNGGTDAARNLPHHVNDDSHFSSAPPSHPPPLPPHASAEGGREGRTSTVATYL
ncbi:PREDICTED: uncharacterized protein LOC109588091 [Amphimedon queenslandica]|uniref:Uncharacterized protein n=1 Tax=Amphimedon queenslandica TaxID=400682 RepID=A0AAN0JSN9_AMPQE|nr:PREDICTED: uncharacterized protein LOC109588091 [Amphimedon queenslandica]|eukprot:XP_019859838.1 PREDICTED: uncharacterized protein LOC109588091 [Amphimedon queenslandica]